MSKYIIEFTKTGTICFTSHLDLMRIFKRAFKRTGIALAYSQGFNPHPKMGFAQPLSLGYWSMEEYIEFETAQEWMPDQLMQRLASGMPEGIDLKRCLPADHLTKTLAAHTVAAQYMIEVPFGGAREHGTDLSGEGASEMPLPGESAAEADPAADLTDARGLWYSFQCLEEIPVWKRQKKKKEPKLVDIKPMIREITFTPVLTAPQAGERSDMGTQAGADGAQAAKKDEVAQGLPTGTLYIDTTLDCGSDSNLSPELVIGTVLRRFGIDTDRSEISVMRRRLLFDQPLEKLL